MQATRKKFVSIATQSRSRARTRTTCSLKGDSPYGLKDGKPFLCFVQSVEHAADLEPQQLDFSTWRDVVKDGYVPDATTHMPTQDAAPVPRLRLAWH